MELKCAYLFTICLFMVFSGCRQQGNNPEANLKIDAQEQELQRIEPLISHYYATNPDSAEFYCYRKIELLKSLNRLETAARNRVGMAIR